MKKFLSLVLAGVITFSAVDQHQKVHANPTELEIALASSLVKLKVVAILEGIALVGCTAYIIWKNWKGNNTAKYSQLLRFRDDVEVYPAKAAHKGVTAKQALITLQRFKNYEIPRALKGEPINPQDVYDIISSCNYVAEYGLKNVNVSDEIHDDFVSMFRLLESQFLSSYNSKRDRTYFDQPMSIGQLVTLLNEIENALDLIVKASATRK